MSAKIIADQSQKLVQAILDLYTHPAWITNADGIVLLNASAQEFENQGVSLRQMKSKNGTYVSVKGQRFRFVRSDMNHGTDCLLHELQETDDATSRLKVSTQQLASLLSQR